MVTKVKTASEIAAMQVGGRMLATVLQYLRPHVEAGISTKELADKAAAELKRLGGEPAFLGYQGFPDVICISVNDEVVHGIPKPNKIINAGDIVGLDFGVRYRGMITDAAISVIAGKPRTNGDKQLLKDTEAALQAGINVVRGGIRTGDIGLAIENSLKHRRYGIVRDLVGHGVGHQVHEDPNIPNFGRADSGPWLQAGMTIAIEPMVTLGTDRVYIAPDRWTVLTADGSRAAHFEHTVLITEEGVEILTTL
ncbi:MAG TPA: type I methionyl aminopeptidase [Candidatus Saccharimonadales bacterium]|jgi:methionyl aminopeptidase|nr:type I methionyl aminopeptidase [Candidatus Saccharimonadales bacterium]